MRNEADRIIYDISRTLEEKLAVWPGDKKFRYRWGARISRGHSCNVSSIRLSVHAGTHLDAPYHFDDKGKDMGSVSLAPCLGPARVVDVPREHPVISAAFLEGLDWNLVERVLFRTRASDLEADRFDRDFVSLAQDGAEFLARRGLQLVGTDAPSVEAFGCKSLLCHKTLYGGGVAILEGVRLAGVPPGDYELICLPLKLAGLDGSPVRAILRTLDA
jgi:arylformamidase